MRRVWAIPILAGWLAGCGTSEVSFEESVAAEPGGRLVVDFAQGSIEVRTHASSEVRVEAVVRGEDAGRVQFFLDRDGRNVELVSEIGLGLPLFPVSLEIDSRIWIPEEFGLEVETTSGDVSAIGIGGDVFVDTSRAAVEIERVRGDVEVKTSRGPIRIEQVSGRIEARTSRSPIEIRGARGRVRARTSRSPLFVHFLGDPAGELVSSRDAVEVRVSPEAAFELDARTSRGRVHVSAELKITRSSSELETDVEINGGGPHLRVRTSRADIRVEVD
ncbi:MAG: hypothetical protein V3V67_12640 [Myxococcota bacterium]